MTTEWYELNKRDSFHLFNPIKERQSPIKKNDLSTDYGPQNEIQKNILVHSLEFKISNDRYTKFKVLQKWEGVVEEFYGQIIIAKLIDLTNGGTDEEVELQLDDISIDDRPYIKKNAMFYWNIGYETSKDGQIRKSSFIRLKRLNKIDPSKFDTIHEQVDDVKNLIFFD